MRTMTQHAPFGKRRSVCYEPASASMTTARPTARPAPSCRLLDAAAGACPDAARGRRRARRARLPIARGAASPPPPARCGAPGIGRGDRVAIALPNSRRVRRELSRRARRAARRRFRCRRRLAPASSGASSPTTPVAALIAARGRTIAASPRPCSTAGDGGLARRAPGAARTVDRAPSPRPTPDDAALVASSSGTLARPHLVVRTHANLWWEAENFFASTQLASRRRRARRRAALARARARQRAPRRAPGRREPACCGRASSAARCSTCWPAERVTVFPAVPVHAAHAGGDRPPAAFDLSALRLCVSAGAPLPRDVVHGVPRRASACAVRQLYGLTEAGSVTCDLAAPERRRSRDRRPAARQRRRHDRGRRTAVRSPPASVGEIVIRSPAAEGGAERPLRTRDLGSRDADGTPHDHRAHEPLHQHRRQQGRPRRGRGRAPRASRRRRRRGLRARRRARRAGRRGRRRARDAGRDRRRAPRPLPRAARAPQGAARPHRSATRCRARRSARS